MKAGKIYASFNSYIANLKCTSLPVVVFVMLLMTSCSKGIELIEGEPTLKVELEPGTYRVGEPVVFKFSGYAGIISFYSGEVFNDYEYREGRILEAGQLHMSFTSNVQYGAQTNQFSVQASTDFKGDHTSPFSTVQEATWTDITSRFELGNNTTYKPSGVKDITDLVEEGKPLFIAFRYIYRPSAQYGLRRTWRIQNFKLTSTTPTLGEQVIGDMATAGFTLFDQFPDIEPSATTINATTISMVGTAVSPNTLTSENWVISRGFETGEVDLGPDRPIAIKGIADAMMTTYEHTYSKPGTYRAYFIAINANIEKKIETIQYVDVTVEP